MTSTSKLPGGMMVVWPELDDDADYAFDHAIAVSPYSGSRSIALEQNGNTISIPLYALRSVLRAMRAVGKVAEEK